MQTKFEQNINWGQIIRSFRERNGYSQKVFGELIEVTPAMVGRYESGKKVKSYDRVISRIINHCPDFKSYIPEATISHKSIKIVEPQMMYRTDDGYLISRNPKTGQLERISEKDSSIIEIEINGEWVSKKLTRN